MWIRFGSGLDFGAAPSPLHRCLTSADSTRGPALQRSDMTLGEMRTLLGAENLRLTRSLGQNFLHDGNQLRRIVTLAGLQPGDPVLEIGPGLGPLTEALLAAGARVLAIEKDARLIPVLQRRLGHHPLLELLHADALDWLAQHPRDLRDHHVVANLPYSVGSPILVELAHAPHPPRSATVTLQAEVVDRLRAKPGTAEFGVLSLLVGRVFTPGPSFRIPATCFFPAPDVTSACIRLDRRPHALAGGPGASPFVTLVKTAFSQRRKQLRKTLRAHWPEHALAHAWTRLGLADTARPEELGVEAFAALAALLATSPPPSEFPPLPGSDTLPTNP